jgi:ABC-type Zn uptake system ZnuABC Zn-binding protein ZnuA
MNRTMNRRAVLTIFSAALLPACRPSPDNSTRSGKLRILTSFLPLQSHAAAIAGDLAQVEQLLTKDAGPHDFQFTPADVQRLAQADLFIINGTGLEEWLGDLVAKAGSTKLTVVDCSANLQIMANPASLDAKVEDGMNPHTWLNPVLAKSQVTLILSALQSADPPNSAAYAANAAAYTAKLDELDAEFRAVLTPLPNKNLVTFHDAFPYLAARYGLNYVGCISEFPEKDPPPQQLAALIEKIRAAKAGVLFAEADYAPGLLTEIARQTGARVSQLDTLEIGKGNAGAYLEKMRANLASLRAAFTAP